MIVMGLDNSTDRVGVGIIEDGKLIHYECIELSKLIKEQEWYTEACDYLDRIMLLKEELKERIQHHKVYAVILEDTTLSSFGGKSSSNNVDVLKKLTKSLGNIEVMLLEMDIAFQTVLPSEWRAGKIKGSDRIAKKKAAIKYVNDKYGLDLQWKGDSSKYNDDDIAEAIMLAEYGYNKLSKQP